MQIAFDQWTQGRMVPTLGTNAGAEKLPFQTWRHFKEAFAPELIARAIEESERPVKRCIDPFGGSGTTALACQFLGVQPTTIEVNPYLADLIDAKLTADAQETANDAGLTKETKTIEDLKKRVDGYTTKIGHLADAEVVLTELNRQSSGDELAARILSENASEIARTFASIHLPNEFDLDAHNGRMRIVRRQTKAAVELNQMSTGQRAAFALSLFLAMNSRLRSGPPVLLFDDPVAHVDDINVLSFLDHLRALAIDGTRQIFFATADSKLAGLFRQKFRFLGQGDFCEIQLKRD